jgi:hypothetical protein
MLYFEDLFGPGVALNLTTALPVPAEISYDRVAGALDRLANRHGGLRVQLGASAADGQFVADETPPLLVAEEQAGSAGSVPARRAWLRCADLFDPRGPRRARFELIRHGQGHGVLLGALDHLIADGTSAEIVTRELAVLLGGGTLPELPTTFQDVCRAQPSPDRIAAEAGEWARRLGDVAPLTGVLPHGSADGVRAQRDRHRAGGAGYHTVHRAARELKCSPFVVIAALCALSLWRRAGQECFLVHTPISTRRDPAQQVSVGNFVNDRPLVCRVSPGESLLTLARRIRGSCAAAVRHSYASVSDLVRAVRGYQHCLQGAGADYVQLHVQVDERRSAAGEYPSDRVERSVLGPFRPSGDITCTTLRFHFSPDLTWTRTFFGGRRGGDEVAAGVSDDVLRLLELVPGSGTAPVRWLAEELPPVGGAIPVIEGDR